MGVNYYFRTPEHEAAGEEGLHICKHSNGYVTSLRGHFNGRDPEITSWEAWKAVLREQKGVIVAEHGLVEDTEAFIAEMDATPRWRRSEHYDRYVVGALVPRTTRVTRKLEVAPYGDWKDRDGFSFHGAEFC